MKYKRKNLLEKLQKIIFVQAIRRALIALIPTLMIGSFSVWLDTLPFDGYIAFITTWKGGFIHGVLTTVGNVTMDMVALYMAAFIGYYMGVLDADKTEKKYGTTLVSLGNFFILSGATHGDYTAFAAKGIFVAIVAAGISSQIYLSVAKRRKGSHILSDGADVYLQNAIQTIVPFVSSIVVIALANDLIMEITGETSFYNLTLSTISSVVGRIESGYIGGLTYVLANSILWFFGIHGSNVMESVAGPIFEQAVSNNMIAIESGQQATYILTRPFLNSYVLIGGCGSTLCLLIALLLFSKRKGTRKLVKIATVPMMFNINELMLFGLPIIFNSVFLIPFIIVPVVLLSISYLVTSWGWVPLAIKDIQWTTPVLFNGFLSTGSWSSVVLQLVNLVIGVAIYAPFVKLYDKRKEHEARAEYELMLDKLKESEASRTPITLIDNTNSFGWMGKSLAADFEYAFSHEKLKLFYQPQYNSENRCIGVEALLRWNHPVFGWIYPPLILKLAEESGVQEKLEKWVVTSAIEGAREIQNKFPNEKIKVSVNVTGASIQKKEFEEFLEKMAKHNDVKKLRICLEITEQDALLLDAILRERFSHLKQLGYVLAVDDFSMGSTSIGYLTESHFEIVKLDGVLVQGIIDNPRCCEIVSSIIRLSDSLNVKVLAEYVSDEKIRKKLGEIGCYLYQGCYYSPAISMEDLEERLEKENMNS